MRGDKARLSDILERMDRVVENVSRKERTHPASAWDLDAVVRNLEVIGEAARAISSAVKDRHAEIPWKEMIGFRVLATHLYWEVEPETVWVIVRGLPALRKKLARIHAKS
jgi:uncharacterized protein with HEPN domain